MSREITVVIKQPEPDKLTHGEKAWKLINDFIKTPFFSFVFGASFATILASFQVLTTPEDLRKAQEKAQEARADAALVGPFISNLNANEPTKLNAAIAALQELDKASKEAHEDKASSPVFAGILAVVTVIKADAQPRVKDIEVSSLPTPTASIGISSSSSLNSEDIFEKLRNAVIYIQITSGSDEQRKQSMDLLKTLRSNSLIAPGIEEIELRKMPNRSQVRFFNESDKAGAAALAKLVSVSTGADVDTIKPPIQAKPGTLEVWFNKVTN